MDSTTKTTTINDNILHFSSQSNNLIRILRVPPNLVLLNDNNNHVIKMQKNLQPIKPAIHPKDTNVKKLKTRRDDFRRVQHNQIERARREKINNLIVELSKKIPDTDESLPQNSGSNTIATSNGRNGDMLSKGGILEKACEYITLLKEKNESLLQNSSTDVRELREENDLLKRENSVLRKKICALESINEHAKPEIEDFKMEYALEPSDNFINI